MPKCDLKVVIDRADKTFRPGETITGAVEVFINDPCECSDLLLMLEWRTHGKGNVDRGEVKKISVFRGTWQPGESLAYEFKLEIPRDAPHTYHGNYLNVDWYVKAQADVPWAIDPKAEADVLVVPSGPSTAGAPRRVIKEPTPRSTVGCALVILILFGGGGTIALILGAPEAMKGDCGGIVAVVVGVVLALIGVAAIVGGVKSAAAEKAVGTVTVEIDRGRARAGDKVALTLRLQPPSPLEVKTISATLEGYEKCVSGSGTNKTTHTNTFLTHTEELCASQRLEASRETVVQGAFRLPADAASSFRSSSNEVLWRITVMIQPSGHVAVKHEVPIEVVP